MRTPGTTVRLQAKLNLLVFYSTQLHLPASTNNPTRILVRLVKIVVRGILRVSQGNSVDPDTHTTVQEADRSRAALARASEPALVPTAAPGSPAHGASLAIRDAQVLAPNFITS